LFEVALNGKFRVGSEVLPLALAFCTWAGLSAIANNYLWCAERARHVMWALAIGLICNVAMNRCMMPAYGLWGAVAATALARCGMFVLLLWYMSRAGMKIDRGLRFVTVLPALLLLGPWAALAGVLAVSLGLVGPIACFTAEERAELWSGVQKVRARLS
jgi:O-antigen/teichoic acid export membrane protein